MKNGEVNDKMWESFKGGDRGAFAAIYDQYAAVLLNYGSKTISDQALVEDCIQDLFIELWTSRERLSSTTSIKFYLFKALRYKIYRKVNASRNDTTESIDDYLSVLRNYPDEENYVEAEVQSLQMSHLKDTLDKLPSRQREAITLRYFHFFSNEEIAQIMGVNYHSACKFIYAGLKNLKENLKVAAMTIVVILSFPGFF